MKSVTSKTTRAGKTLYLLVTALGVLLFSLSLVAQANFGRILGTVTDQTGAVIAGAAVTVIDTEHSADLQVPERGRGDLDRLRRIAIEFRDHLAERLALEDDLPMIVLKQIGRGN